MVARTISCGAIIRHSTSLFPITSGKGCARGRRDNTYVDLVPGEWTKLKVEVSGVKARLYVHGATQPALIVNDLKLGDSKGAVALWIGLGTEAYFANLRLSN